MDEAHFLDSALSSSASAWNNSSLGELARLQVPDGLLGPQRSLLRADINEQWARWFVESLVDPRRYAQNGASYPQIFADIFRTVDQRFYHFTQPQKKELASSAAKILEQLVNQYQVSRGRQPVSFGERRLLLDMAGDTPRCWICGSSFAQEAIENFLYQDRHDIPLPQFLDILKPRGLFRRDLAIEIDHVVPYSRGGAEQNNLALACGWCNRHKGAFSSIYEIEGRPRSARFNELGINSLPQPFWTVRTLATIRKCEHRGGCKHSSATANVTIAPVNEIGALNPANVRVTCHEHDPIRHLRLQSTRVVSDLWGK